MQPELFEFVLNENISFKIGAYRFFGLLAGAYFTFIVFRYLNVNKINFLIKTTLILTGVVFFFIGSRIFYTILYFPGFLNEPLMLFQLSLRNFTLYGGLLSVLFIWWLFTKKTGLAFLSSLDYFVPHLGISIALMRVGCFLNGCCYGKVTAMPWGIPVLLFSPSHLAQIHNAREILKLAPQAVHPTQLYEIVVALAASLTAYIVYKKTDITGLTTMVFALLFSLGRLIVFYYRSFPLANETSNLIRGPLLYGMIILFSLFWIAKCVKRD